MMTEQQLFTYVNVVICAELMSGYMEDLKDTPHYRQSIKSRCKGLSEDLEPILNKELPKIFAADEQFTINCMKEFKGLVENLSNLSMNHIIAINQLITEYKKDPDRFLDKHQLTLTKIE